MVESSLKKKINVAKWGTPKIFINFSELERAEHVGRR